MASLYSLPLSKSSLHSVVSKGISVEPEVHVLHLEQEEEATKTKTIKTNKFFMK